MGKITTLFLLMSGLDLLFYFSGIVTTNNTLLNLLLNPSTIVIASIVSGVLTFGAAIANLFATTGGITVGSIFTNVRYAFVIPFVLYIAKLMGDSLIIVNRMISISPVFAVLFASPLLIIAMLSIYALWDSGITV